MKSALGHKDMKTTIRVYAKTGKDAERQARETAHATWMPAPKAEADEKDNVVQLKQAT